MKINPGHVDFVTNLAASYRRRAESALLVSAAAHIAGDFETTTVKAGCALTLELLANELRASIGLPPYPALNPDAATNELRRS